MPTPPSSSSSDPLKFQSVISALWIAGIFFLITEALDDTISATLIPFLFIVISLVVFLALDQIIPACRLSNLSSSSSSSQTQTHRRLHYRDQIQIYVYSAVDGPVHNDQPLLEDLERVLPPPVTYSKPRHEGEEEKEEEEEEGNERSSTSSWKQCAICMEDFEEGASCRVLPSCHHMFHLNCIDSWLKLRPSCPICRNSICKSTHCVTDV